MHEDSSEPSPTPPLPRKRGGGSRPSLPLALMPTHRGCSTPRGRCSFRPHPEERAPEIVVRTPHARARVSKDGGGPRRGGLLLRDASQRNRARGNRRVRPRCDAPQHEAIAYTLLLESFDEPLEQPGPDLVLADLVLDAVLEVGVVVDLHDDEAVVGLLDVDPVEPLPDRPGRAHRDVDQSGRRLTDLEGAKAAFARGAVGAMLDDLPMAARHAV